MHVASVKLAGSKIFINNGILIVLQKIGIFKVRMFCIQCNLKVCIICGYIQLGYEYLYDAWSQATFCEKQCFHFILAAIFINLLTVAVNNSLRCN